MAATTAGDVDILMGAHAVYNRDVAFRSERPNVY
jgi:hypothetical protein